MYECNYYTLSTEQKKNCTTFSHSSSWQNHDDFEVYQEPICTHYATRNNQAKGLIWIIT